jgi:anti-sigma factor (TIGR02949 family)
MRISNGSNEHCDWVLNRLEAYLDGELPAGETAPIESHLSACESCRRELALARQVASMLRSLPEQSCPDTVVEAAARSIEGLPAPAAEPRAGRLSGWWREFLHPAAAAAALILVVAMTVFIGQEYHYRSTTSGGSEDTLELSPEQIALAKAEIKWTFAYLDRVGRHSGLAVRAETIDHVVKPIEQALDIAFESRATDRTNRTGN